MKESFPFLLASEEGKRNFCSLVSQLLIKSLRCFLGQGKSELCCSELSQGGLMEILEFPSLWGFVFIFAFSICKMTKAEHEQSHTLGTGYCLSLKCQEAESEVKPGFADRSPFLGTVQGQQTEPASNARLHGVCVWLEPGRARGRYWGESPRSTAHARTRAVGTSWAPPASPRSAVCSAGPGHFKTRTSGGLRAQERWLCPRPRPSTTSPREESNQLAKSDHVHAFCRH